MSDLTDAVAGELRTVTPALSRHLTRTVLGRMVATIDALPPPPDVDEWAWAAARRSVRVAVMAEWEASLEPGERAPRNFT